MKKNHERWRWNRAINCYTARTAYNAYITIREPFKNVLADFVR